MNRRIAVGVLVALFVGAAGLIAFEFANGAADAGALARGRWLQARSTNVSKAVDFAGVEGENTARSKPEDRWPKR